MAVTGARASSSHADPTSSAKGPDVRVRGLGKRYGTQWASRDLSFDVKGGEIFGIIGPNGAGKTTTLKILAGLLAPTSGEATVGGRRVDDPAHRARIGYLPEESPLYEDMTPVAYLRFFASLYDVPRKVADTRINGLLDDLKLEWRDDKRIGDMSKGQRRKVAIARALVNEPDLLIFDEPASGLDPVVSAHILDLVEDFRDRGMTVIFSAHNLYHVERICDRVLILKQGQPIAVGDMQEIRERTQGREYRVRVSIPLDGTKPTEGGHETIVGSLARVAEIEAQAKAADGRVLHVESVDLPLEEIFLRTAVEGGEERAARGERRGLGMGGGDAA